MTTCFLPACTDVCTHTFFASETLNIVSQKAVGKKSDVSLYTHSAFLTAALHIIHTYPHWGIVKYSPETFWKTKDKLIPGGNFFFLTFRIWNWWFSTSGVWFTSVNTNLISDDQILNWKTNIWEIVLWNQGFSEGRWKPLKTSVRSGVTCFADVAWSLGGLS